MNKIIAFTFFISVLALEAFACSCTPVEMEANFEQADFVIIGEVQKIKDLTYRNIKNTFHYVLNPAYVKNGGYLVDISTKKVLKGSVPSTITLTPGWHNCDYYFKKDKKYVIFGFINEDGEYRTSICTSTFFKENSKKFEQLKKIL